MKKIVLTGGPCSGKTTILQAMREEFADRIVVVPEAATLLLANGFPVPGQHLPWSPAWQVALQDAILPLQFSLEDAWGLAAQHRGSQLLICDRGALDGAAYTPGGAAEFCVRHHLRLGDVLARYDAVIHLESLAAAAPERYGTEGNPSRFETLAEAQRLEGAVRSLWARHARHIVIAGHVHWETKAAQVLGLIREWLG